MKPPLRHNQPRYDRRGFLVRGGVAAATSAIVGAGQHPVVEGRNAAPTPTAAGVDPAPVRQAPRADDWSTVRDQFALTRNAIHLGAFLLASHPTPVREAIERHRRGLDENPVDYLRRQSEFDRAVLRAAATYLEAQPGEIALTDSTTMGLGLLYGGFALEPGQEVLTTEHDYYSTQEALRLRVERVGGTVRKIRLFDHSADASVDEIVSRLQDAITDRTRLLALTWVHSSTGLKLPVRAIADMLAEVNRRRDWPDRALLAIDGVHGFGVEAEAVTTLGCDFFVAGCHKWLFGPRGTGLIWGHRDMWPSARATIPSFTGDESPGSAMTPGGFHSFEHRWALAEAFDFHQAIGRTRVAERIHELNRQCKQGLAGLNRVKLHTPMADELSAGLVCFEVEGLAPREVARRLREQRIIATVTPYRVSYARLAPSLLNSPEEIDTTLNAVRSLTLGHRSSAST